MKSNRNTNKIYRNNIQIIAAANCDAIKATTLAAA